MCSAADALLLLPCAPDSNVIAATTTTDWRQTFLRGMMTQQATNRGIHTDVLANWEAVKCFTAERHESGRYEKGVGRASVFHYYLYCGSPPLSACPPHAGR